MKIGRNISDLTAILAMIGGALVAFSLSRFGGKLFDDLSGTIPNTVQAAIRMVQLAPTAAIAGIVILALVQLAMKSNRNLVFVHFAYLWAWILASATTAWLATKWS